MGDITKSRLAMTLAAWAAVVYAVGSAFAIGKYAAFTGSTAGTSTNLGHASDWLHFIGWLTLLVGVCVVGWELVLQKKLDDIWEVAVAAAATLLIAIGALVSASSSSLDSFAYVVGDIGIVGAIGVGGWAVLALIRAARRSLLEQEQSAGQTRQATLWLGVTVGALMLAVGSGFTPGFGDQGLAIAQGVVQALGVAILVATFAIARSGRVLVARSMPSMITGLAIIAVAFLAEAVVAGIAHSSSGTLTGFRIGALAYERGPHDWRRGPWCGGMAAR